MTAQSECFQQPAIRAFGAVLEARRVEASLSTKKLAEALGYTPAYVGQCEAAKNVASQKFAEDCDTYFRAGELFLSLWKLIDETKGLAALPPGFTDFIEREAEARTLYIFAAMIIHGLFQTREYIYEVLKPGRTAEVTEQLVSKRLERQEILTRDDPPQIVAVFDEIAIRRIIGNPAVMKDQIARLIEIAEMPNVTLHIVAADQGAYPGVMGAFTTLRFDAGPDMAYTEDHAGGNLTDSSLTVRKYAVAFDLIRGAAMSAQESLKLLRTVGENP